MFHQVLFLILCLEFVMSTSSAPGFYIGYNVEESRGIELNYSAACQECANLGLSIANIDSHSTFHRANEYVDTFNATYNMYAGMIWIDACSTFEIVKDDNKCILISDNIPIQETCDTEAYFLCQGFIYEQETHKNWDEAKIDCESKGAELSQLKTIAQRYAAAQHITVMNNMRMEISSGGIIQSVVQWWNDGVYFGLRKLEGKFIYLDGTEDEEITPSLWWINCVRLKNNLNGTFAIERIIIPCGKFLYICTMELSTMSIEQEVVVPTTAEAMKIPSEDEPTSSSAMSTKSNGQEVVWPTTTETMNIPSEDETTTVTSSEMSTMTTKQEVVLPTTAETINIPSEDETTTSSELMVDDDNKETAKRQQEIKEALQLNAKKTVLALNKKICAEDNRPSAVALGSVAGICVITIVLAIIIIPDLPRLWEHVTNGVPYEDKKRQKKE